jgi:hypothetical protein
VILQLSENYRYHFRILGVSFRGIYSCYYFSATQLAIRNGFL